MNESTNKYLFLVFNNKQAYYWVKYQFTFTFDENSKAIGYYKSMKNHNNNGTNKNGSNNDENKNIAKNVEMLLSVTITLKI